MDLHFEYNGAPVTLRAERAPEGWRVELPGGASYTIADGRRGELRATLVSSAAAEGRAPDQMLAVPFARVGNSRQLSWQGSVYSFTRPSLATARPATGTGRAAVTAIGGGVVSEVFVAEGQNVTAFQALAVIEAMKVMTTVEAPYTGTVATLFVAPGQRVEAGETIAVIEPAASGVGGVP